jgi:hypothetical protein
MIKNGSNNFYKAIQWFVLIALFLIAMYYKVQNDYLTQKYVNYVNGNTYVIKYQSDQLFKLKLENINLYKQVCDNEIDKAILNMDDKYLNNVNNINNINNNSKIFSSNQRSVITYTGYISK